MDEVPSLILTKGVFIAEGSGGNHRYVFNNGIYKYECRIEAMGKADNGELRVYKGEKEILVKAAKLIRNGKEKVNSDTGELDASNFIIGKNSVGKFKVMDAMPFSNVSDPYEVRKVTGTRMEEGSENNYTNYILSEQHVDLLIKTELALVILSDKFKTVKGIGVNSTIEEFIKQYPDYYIWYSYVSDTYVIQTKELECHFVLNDKDFIGKLNITSDQVLLKKSEFKKNAKIIKVRMF